MKDGRASPEGAAEPDAWGVAVRETGAETARADGEAGSAEPVRLYVEPKRVPWYVAAFGWLAPLFL